MSGIDARRSLVVKVRQLVALFRGQKPEVEERGWEDGVYFSSSKTDERSQREGHLSDLGIEGRVALACGLHSCCCSLFWGQV